MNRVAGLDDLHDDDIDDDDTTLSFHDAVSDEEDTVGSFRFYLGFLLINWGT